MGRDLTNEECDAYMNKVLHDYLCHLECNGATNEAIFMYQVDKLVDVWKEIFYDETNKRINTVRKEDFPKIAAEIAKLLYNIKHKVPYVDNRVTITEDALNDRCLDIVGKFYTPPPYAKQIISYPQ